MPFCFRHLYLAARQFYNTLSLSLLDMDSQCSSVTYNFVRSLSAVDSEDLRMIRPVALKREYLNQLQPDFRECRSCHERLDQDSIQMWCCSEFFHRTCFLGWAEWKAEQKPNSSSFECPWCRQDIHAFPHDILMHLSGSREDFNQMKEVIPQIEEYLQMLEKLTLEARLAFLMYLDIFAKSGHVLSMRTEGLKNTVYKSCNYDPFQRDIADYLFHQRNRCCSPLLTWLGWLEEPTDLMHWDDWVSIPTRYGEGPDRFKPQIAERMRVQEEVLSQTKDLDQDQLPINSNRWNGEVSHTRTEPAPRPHAMRYSIEELLSLRPTPLHA